MTDLGREDFYESTTGLNNRGDVIGTFNVPPYAYPCSCVGGRLRDGVVTQLRAGTGDGFLSEAIAINNRGEVLGHSPTSNGWWPGVWRAGTLTYLELFDDSHTAYGLSLNDRGEVLGRSYTIDLVQRPFLWRRGVATDLTTRGLTTSDAPVALNDRGELAGARGGRPALFR